jgi:hypothetical protein
LGILNNAITDIPIPVIIDGDFEDGVGVCVKGII